MLEYYSFLGDILLGIEFLSALVAIIYFRRLKHSYWRFLAIYLVFIFIQELFWKFNSSLAIIRKQDYYLFFGIPVQYIFLFWLYALKSLKNKKMFLICLILYSTSFIPLTLKVDKINVVYSLNLTIGTILLSILVVLEFLKQIKNDDILKFKENKMFYINLGVIFFYIGTYPLFSFYDYLSKSLTTIWNYYYLYFLISNCIMYLLFSASFIWGKTQS
ncbi:hypothetical protein [Olleya sp. ITB9]|uniref:hypothetical protein n=1 Tax=Olleya sp. ITB9 TaxID=1715648 RepID=UPI0006D1B20D|nr:hypothetical protein [Olleya sp. ITB9]